MENVAKNVCFFVTILKIKLTQVCICLSFLTLIKVLATIGMAKNGFSFPKSLVNNLKVCHLLLIFSHSDLEALFQISQPAPPISWDLEPSSSTRMAKLTLFLSSASKTTVFNKMSQKIYFVVSLKLFSQEAAG